MSEEDSERLLELCKNEIYAQMLGAPYEHTKEDRVWWNDLKYQNPDEFEFLVRHAKEKYGWYRWKGL
jgi:hypothetical protein